MMTSHSCTACMAPLQPEDGHDLCPSCLGLEHLREGLSEDPCMNCSFMPRAVRAARLAEVERLFGGVPSPEGLTDIHRLSPARPSRPKRRAPDTEAASSRKKAKECELASRVDHLTAELNQMKSIFLALQTGMVQGVCVRLFLL